MNAEDKIKAINKILKQLIKHFMETIEELEPFITQPPKTPLKPREKPPGEMTFEEFFKKNKDKKMKRGILQILTIEGFSEQQIRQMTITQIQRELRNSVQNRLETIVDMISKIKTRATE